VSATVETGFQLASTALTVTSKAVPAIWASGVPVLPVAVPGTAVWPGTRICNFVNAPGSTGIAGLVLPGTLTWVTFEAVTVALPAVLRVTLKVFVPLTSAALDGAVALVSLSVIAIVSLVLKTFQFVSTALTVT